MLELLLSTHNRILQWKGWLTSKPDHGSRNEQALYVFIETSSAQEIHISKYMHIAIASSLPSNTMKKGLPQPPISPNMWEPRRWSTPELQISLLQSRSTWSMHLKSRKSRRTRRCREVSICNAEGQSFSNSKAKKKWSSTKSRTNIMRNSLPFHWNWKAFVTFTLTVQKLQTWIQAHYGRRSICTFCTLPSCRVSSGVRTNEMR